MYLCVLSHIIITVVLYSLSLLFYFVTVSYCCTHMTSTIHCCVISVTVIHSYKILLCLWYLAYCSCMYVAIVCVKMCLSISNVSKCGGNTKQNERLTYHSTGLKVFHIQALEEYLNLYNKNQQTHMYEVCFITLLITDMFDRFCDLHKGSITRVLRIQ